VVSIITPTYNCGNFIADAIRSVQAQTYSKWELIIVDDCSKDNTSDIVKPFLTDNRIKYIKFDHTCGAAMARNRGIREAKGEWIAFLDSDDLWHAEKLERQLAFMKTNGYAFSYHEYTEIDEQGNDLGVHVSGLKRVNRLAMLSCCWPGCLTVMYNRNKIGLLQIADIKKNNDTALWLQVAKKAPCMLLTETLACYRRRTGSVTPTDISSKIMWHYRLFRQAEHMNWAHAWFWTITNIIGNSYKKVFYVHHQKV